MSDRQSRPTRKPAHGKISAHGGRCSPLNYVRTRIIQRGTGGTLRKVTGCSRPPRRRRWEPRRELFAWYQLWDNPERLMPPDSPAGPRKSCCVLASAIQQRPDQDLSRVRRDAEAGVCDDARTKLCERDRKTALDAGSVVGCFKAYGICARVLSGRSSHNW